MYKNCFKIMILAGILIPGMGYARDLYYGDMSYNNTRQAGLYNHVYPNNLVFNQGDMDNLVFNQGDMENGLEEERKELKKEGKKLKKDKEKLIGGIEVLQNLIDFAYQNGGMVYVGDLGRYLQSLEGTLEDVQEQQEQKKRNKKNKQDIAPQQGDIIYYNR